MENKEYKIVPFTKLNAPGHYIKTKVIPWCEEISIESHPNPDKGSPAAYNMGALNWLERNETLANILWNKKRFYKGNGQYYFLEKNNAIIAGSGIHRSEFCPEIALGSVRSFVNKEYRGYHFLGDILWPAQLAWATRNNYKMIIITVNKYNRRLLNIIKRNGVGHQKNRTIEKFFHNGVVDVPFPIEINGITQWAIGHRIDEAYKFDWELIRSHTEKNTKLQKLT
jgi:hypothetical protein